MAFDPIPQARVVRKAGHLVTPPRAPHPHGSHSIGDYTRNALSVAIGLWPLTAVMLFLFAMLIMAGRMGGP